jgi:hypothetical protein
MESTIMGLGNKTPMVSGAAARRECSQHTNDQGSASSFLSSLLCTVGEVGMLIIDIVLLFVQQETSLANYRRPGRPKGSRDRAPRTKNAKRDAAIRHTDSSWDEKDNTTLELCCKEKETAEETEHTNASQGYPSCRSNQTVPFFSDSVQNDPFHADWPFW